MNDREKLIELLTVDHCHGYGIEDCYECQYCEYDDCYTARTADHLLANGVTVQRWIPVTERLPEADKRVLVFTAHGNVKVARCNFYKNGTEVSWATNDGLGERAITHWMPLPEPPKEDAE